MASDRSQADDPNRPAESNRLFLIVDPNLRDVVGHYFEYDRTVAEGAASRGYTPVVMGHHEVEAGIVQRIGAHAVFTRDIWGLAARGGGVLGYFIGKLRDNARFLLELRRALRRFGLPPGSVVFAHTFIDRQFLALALLPLVLGRTPDVQFNFLLRYQPHFYTGPIGALAFRLIEWLARTRRIHLTTDSQRLAEQLGRLTNRPVHVLPIPHVPPDTPARAGRDPDAPTCFVSLGNARDEKGIMEILDAIRILHDSGQSSGMRFVLQCNDAAPDVQAAIDAFRALNIPHCDLLPDKLDSDEYYRLLLQADVVLVPYWRSIYIARTSGVFMEALSAGKPVIATADTWMSDQLAEHGAGLQGRDRSPDVLAALMLRASLNRADLTAAALGSRTRWLETHNPLALISAIDALHDATPPARPPRNVLILYPYDDFLGRQGGASRRVNLLAEFLVKAGMHVRVLQDGDSPRVASANLVVDGLGPERRLRLARAMIGGLVWVLSWGQGMRHRWMFWQYACIGLDQRKRRRIRQEIRWADTVILEYPFWADAILPFVRQAGRPVIMTAHDILSDQLTDHPGLYAWGWRKERRAWAGADHLVAVSTSDQKRIGQQGLSATLAANPTDGRLFEIERLADARVVLRDVYDIDVPAGGMCLFVGSSHGPNLHAVETIRAVAAATPEVFFIIAGACAEPQQSGNFLALGRVSDAVLLLLYAACDVVLVPIPEGTGSSLKTVEGIAARRVVLGTTSAFRGLSVTSGVDVIVEDDVDAYPTRIRAILADVSASDACAERARACARRYDFRIAYQPYLPILGCDAPCHAPAKDDAGTIDATLIQIGKAAADAGCLAIAHRYAREALRTSPHDADASALLLVRPSSPPSPVAVSKPAEPTPAPVEPTHVQAPAALVVPLWYQEREDTWARFSGRDYAVVIARAEAALADEPSQADAHFLLAQSLHNECRDLDRALYHYSQALKHGYPAYWVRFGRGRLAREQGAADAALRDLLAAWLMKPISGSLPSLFHEMLLALRTKVRRSHPVGSNAGFTRAERQALWRAHSQAKFAEVVDALADNPCADGDAELQFLLGMCLHDSGGDPVRAATHYMRARDLGWDAVWVRYCMGRLLRECGRSAKALRMLIPVLLLRPYRRIALSSARQIALAVSHWNRIERPSTGPSAAML